MIQPRLQKLDAAIREAKVDLVLLTSLAALPPPRLFWNVTSWEVSLWLLTMTTMGPAPSTELLRTTNPVVCRNPPVEVENMFAPM